MEVTYTLLPFDADLYFFLIAEGCSMLIVYLVWVYYFQLKTDQLGD